MEKLFKSVVIIGAGRIASSFDSPISNKVLTHAHSFSLCKEFKLIGFYDTNYESATNAANIWNCKAFKNLEDALQSADVVCCCVPDEFHYRTLMKIAEYPVKLVIAEKPVATSLKDALEIKQMYIKKNIPIMINYSRRYIVEYQVLRQDIRNMGKFLKGTAYYGKGIIHNGSHILDLLSFLLTSEQKVKEVTNKVNDFYANDASYDIKMEISSGIFSMVAVDCRAVTVFEVDLFFEKSRVRIINGGNRIEIYSICESSDYSGYYNYVLSRTIDIDYSGAMCGLVDNAAKFLDGEAPLICGISDGINAMETCEKIKGMANV